MGRWYIDLNELMHLKHLVKATCYCHHAQSYLLWSSCSHLSKKGSSPCQMWNWWGSSDWNGFCEHKLHPGTAWLLFIRSLGTKLDESWNCFLRMLHCFTKAYSENKENATSTLMRFRHMPQTHSKIIISEMFSKRYAKNIERTQKMSRSTYYFLNIFIWVTETESSHLPIQPQNACSQSWDPLKLELEAGIQSQVPMWLAGTQDLSHHPVPTRASISRTLGLEVEPELEFRHFSENMGVLPTRLNACPGTQTSQAILPTCLTHK